MFSLVAQPYVYLSLPPVQVGVKETLKTGWLSSRKWCGSSWRARCTASSRSCWTPPRGLKKRFAHKVSSPTPSDSLQPSGYDLEVLASLTNRGNTKLTWMSLGKVPIHKQKKTSFYQLILEESSKWKRNCILYIFFSQKQSELSNHMFVIFKYNKCAKQCTHIAEAYQFSLVSVVTESVLFSAYLHLHNTWDGAIIFKQVWQWAIGQIRLYTGLYFFFIF